MSFHKIQTFDQILLPECLNEYIYGSIIVVQKRVFVSNSLEVVKAKDRLLGHSEEHLCVLLGRYSREFKD